MIWSAICASLSLAMAWQGSDPAPPPRQSPFPPFLEEPEPLTPRNGRVENMNAKTFAALRVLRNAGSAGVGTDTARKIGAIVMADGVLDAQEREFLEELMHPRARAINIFNAKDNTATLVFASVGYTVRPIFVDIIAPPVDFATAWEGGATGWAVIVKEVSKGGYYESRATKFVMTKLDEAWALSTTTNAYKPFRDVVNVRYAFAKAMPKGEAEAGRLLLHSASARVDWKYEDKLPDFLYNWIKPETP